MQLTTPNTNDFDSVFPGENWFFYWRTSPSLWEAKLQHFLGVRPIFVPLNWSLHSDQPGVLDFGEFKPETDLKRLSEIATKLGIELVYLLPITPAPYLNNGGLPSYISRHHMIGKDSLLRTVLSNDGSINKLFTFYDPKIFQAFGNYVDKLSMYFRTHGIGHQVLGVHSHLMEGNHPVSTMEDFSDTFFQGLSRYIKTLDEDTQDERSFKLNSSRYHNEILNLYKSLASESLRDLWGGVINYSFIGSDNLDLIERNTNKGLPSEVLIKQTLNSTLYGIIPNSNLLMEDERGDAIQKTLNSIVTRSLITSKLESSIEEDDDNISFSPIRYFKLLTRGREDHLLYESIGFKDYIQDKYAYSFLYQDNLDFDFESIDPNMTHFFNISTLDDKALLQVFRLFMNGAKILMHVDKKDLPFEKRIFSFMLENRIEEEVLKFTSTISRYQLGDGEFILFDSEKLVDLQAKKQSAFWETLISYLKIAQVEISGDDGVHYFWQKRGSTSFELNYEEVRRVQLYNYSSYKKKIRLDNKSDFAFLKMIDVKDVDLNSTPTGVELTFKPQGSISLDYGYIGD